MEYKLKEILDYIHNYFVLDTYTGEITIKNHELNNKNIELYDGQYFMIKGSIFNDGIWKYTRENENKKDVILINKNLEDNSESEENLEHEEELLQDEEDLLQDEVFYGDVMSLKIPRDVIKILDDINKWESENQNAINGVFQSESFGGYSYSLKSGSSNNGKSQGAISWKDIFGNKLNCYRKLG